MQLTAKRWTPGLADIFGTLVVFVMVMRPGGMAGDPGIGWHVRIGEMIAQSWSVPKTDPKLLTTAPWIHNQWLADVLFAAAIRIGGWPFLELGAIAVIVMALNAIVMLQLRRESAADYGAFLVLLVLYCLVGVQWFLRPVILSFFLFAVLSTLLRRWYLESNVRILYAVPLLFLLWTNLHPGFSIGFLLLGAYEVALVWSREFRRAWLLLICGLASLLATVVNPYGIAVHLQILSLLADNYFMNLNMEWLSPDLSDLLFLPFVLVVSILPLVVSEKLKPMDWVLLLLFSGAALSSRRYIPFFGIAAAPIFARLVPPITRARTLTQRLLALLARWNRGTVWQYSCAALLLSGLWIFSAGALPTRTAASSSPDSHFPRGAAQYLSEHASEQSRIFAPADWGGYLSLRGAGRFFLDDRNELQGRERYEQLFVLVRALPGWKGIARQFDLLVLPPEAPVHVVLAENSEWKLVYSDSESVIYSRVT